MKPISVLYTRERVHACHAILFRPDPIVVHSKVKLGFFSIQCTAYSYIDRKWNPSKLENYLLSAGYNDDTHTQSAKAERKQTRGEEKNQWNETQ